MYAAFIIILSLVLAIVEQWEWAKKHKGVKWAVLAILVLLAILSGCEECNSSNEQKVLKADIDSLKGNSVSLHETVKYLIDENYALHKEHADSLENYHYKTTEILANQGIQIDEVKNTVVKTSKGNNLAPANITSYFESTDGVTKTTIGDTILTTIRIANTGKLPAYDITGAIYVLYMKDNVFYKKKVRFTGISIMQLPPDKGIDISKPIKKSNPLYNRSGYQEYYFVTGEYWDKEHQNKSKFYFVYIYEEDNPFWKCSLPNYHIDMSKAIEDAVYLLY